MSEDTRRVVIRRQGPVASEPTADDTPNPEEAEILDLVVGCDRTTVDEMVRNAAASSGVEERKFRAVRELKIHALAIEDHYCVTQTSMNRLSREVRRLQSSYTQAVSGSAQWYTLYTELEERFSDLAPDKVLMRAALYGALVGVCLSYVVFSVAISFGAL